MNTEKLYKLLDSIIKAEKKFATQEYLEMYGNAFIGVVISSQDVRLASSAEERSNLFFTSMEGFQEEFTQNDYLRVCSISEHFASNIYSVVKYTNDVDMSVLQDRVNKLIQIRSDVFNKIRDLKENFDYFEIIDKNYKLEEKEETLFEIGFTIPRNLFDNSFDGMIEETKDIQRIVRFFSEATLGKYEPAKLRSISTSDPLYHIILDPQVIMCIAGAVTWALHTQEKYEKIRKLREEIKNLKIRTEKEIQEFFNMETEKAILSAAAEKKAKEILKNGNPPKDRHGELIGQLKWSLESLAAKIERGLKIEYQAPPPTDGAEEDDAKKVEIEKFRKKFINIERTHIFPEPSDNPTLQIPKYKEYNGNKNEGENDDGSASQD